MTKSGKHVQLLYWSFLFLFIFFVNGRNPSTCMQVED